MSGSEKRQRTDGIFVRLTPAEKATIKAKADTAGLEPSGFLRNAGLETNAPRARRRPPADHVALRQILGHCGKIGSNLNQIARHLNTGGQPDIPQLTIELNSYKEIRTAIYTALHMNPADDNKRK